ncbi:MAG TPA: ACP S-malonyltransferase [Fimbriimonadaceae bacterium]|jgi:[acyl-carrier-protein] S-malonyltransferase
MIAAVFPGQGSQKPGMGKELYEASAAAKEVFLLVAEATGIDAKKLCFETDEDTLRQTQNAQLAQYTTGVAAYRAIKERAGNIHFHAMAGHSVGEYAALAAAGIVTVEDGAKLVQRRGDLMSRAGNLRKGGMAAVLGMETEAIEQACKAASTASEQVVIANDNCPGQIVVSGDQAAVARFETIAKEQGAKRVLPLNVSGAFHSPLMEDSAIAMAEALNPSLFHNAEGIRVYSNVTADRVDGSTEWPELLGAQLRNPVRWTESVQNMIKDGVTTFVECGSGEVLSGLIRRISKEVQTLSVNDNASLANALIALYQQEVTV